MTLRLVRSPSNSQLWDACIQRFLDDLQGRTGPDGHTSWLWLTHRLQRDALYRKVAELGVSGWLRPPVSFFSDLPRTFDVREPPIGLLARRALIGRIARERAGSLGVTGSTEWERRGIAVALDGLFGELLPEGVGSDELRERLADVADDEFSRRRDRWVLEVYEAYLSELRARGRYDPRAIHAVVAERIRAGGLSRALHGAGRLHIYGLTSTRTHRRLLKVLRDSGEVDVSVYLTHVEEPGEWDELGAQVEDLAGEPPPGPDVQPAPDGRREFEWIACQVRDLLATGAVRADEVAIVARTGREDGRRAHEILNAAGIPNTARTRNRLAEIPALKAVLALFRGAARGWRYRPLRHVLESSYFDLNIDLRAIDHIARKRRVVGLEAWGRELRRLHDSMTAVEDDWAFRREGLFADRLARDLEGFEEFRAQVERLSGARTLAGWVALTRQLLRPGWFDFRSRLCNDDGERWEVVRLDQRGVERLDRMLVEWPEDDGEGEESLEPGEWYARLRRFLESNELALTTPLQTGVQILEAHEAALLPAARTFVVHANDGEFPRRPPTPVVFSDEERSALAARGIPLTHRDLWLRRERALWRAVTGNPGVTLTYRTADSRGVPLLPSLMVPAHDASKEIPRTRYTWPVAFNAVQARRRAAERMADMKKGREPGAIRVADPDALRHAVLAAYAESQRGENVDGTRQAGALCPWNGELRDPWLLGYLADHFGPKRVWSASQLEGYAECPFVYFVQRVLWLDELAEAEEETTPLTFGGVAHTILERFYPELLAGPLPDAFDEGALEVYERVAEAVVAEVEADEGGWLGLPALWAVTRRDIVGKVRDYLAWELPELGDWRPHDFEHSFGADEGDVVEIEGIDLAGHPQTLRVRGRVDRVDLKGAGSSAVYRILDYKSGGLPAKTHYEHGVVQIPLYMKALARRLGGPIEYGGYRSIKNRKEGGQADWDDENFQTALRIALSIPARVREGKFEPQAAKPCDWPDYWPGLSVCRVKHVLREVRRFS